MAHQVGFCGGAGVWVGKCGNGRDVAWAVAADSGGESKIKAPTGQGIQWERWCDRWANGGAILRSRWGKGAIGDGCARLYIKGCGADDAEGAA